jgi:hypothetical protein
LCPDTPISVVTRVDSRTNRITCSKRFYTLALFKDLRSVWYKPYINATGNLQYKKVLPDNTSLMFTSTFVTLWFAGDGTKTIGHRGAKFEVTCYTPEERQLLKKLRLSKFGISPVINRAGVSKSGTEQWTLNIKSANYAKFYDLVTQIDLIPSIFPYKLHNRDKTYTRKKVAGPVDTKPKPKPKNKTNT